MKPELHSFFPTYIYQSSIWPQPKSRSRFHRELIEQCMLIRDEDIEGQTWSKDHYLNGYTSYGSLSDLHLRFPHFEELEKRITVHAKKYASKLHWDLQSGHLKMSSCWVNIMEQNSIHSLHLHPLSVISGTYYVQVPKGASQIKFEDPRLSKMMACPPRKLDAPLAEQPFISVAPQAGDIILFESWIRHEVPMSRVKEPRISISFNYDWV